MKDLWKKSHADSIVVRLHSIQISRILYKLNIIKPPTKYDWPSLAGWTSFFISRTNWTEESDVSRDRNGPTVYLIINTLDCILYTPSQPPSLHLTQLRTECCIAVDRGEELPVIISDFFFLDFLNFSNFFTWIGGRRTWVGGDIW